ncbi:MAG TPA: DUF484 family protein [Caulobacteraceae bacterium]
MSGAAETSTSAWGDVRAFLLREPERIREDDALLSELGLRVNPTNVVEFLPAALSRSEAAREREMTARQHIEAAAKANFVAQAQTHAAVVDLLESRNHADLARRVDEAARHRYGLICGLIAIEGPERAPVAWRDIGPGGVDDLLGREGLARMGPLPEAECELLFGEEHAASVQSAALVRMAMWSPARQGVLAFASEDPYGFQPSMGSELVAFLARVVERTAERWPVL